MSLPLAFLRRCCSALPLFALVSAVGAQAPSPVPLRVPGDCQAPVLTASAPIAASPGFAVTLSGSNLDGVTAVTFGAESAPAGLAAPDRIETRVPTLPPGPVTVRVTKPCGSASLPSPFLVLAPASSCVLSVLPSRLSFNARVGSTGPLPAQALSLGSLLPAVSFTVQEDSPFLSLGTAFGVTPAQLNVVADPTGLPEGAYSATLRIACSSGGSGAPLTVPVDLVVSRRIVMAPRLSASPASLTFVAPQGSNPPAADLTVQSTESPEFELDFSAGNPITPRLQASPTTGRTPRTVSVSLNSSDLAAGTYDFTLIVASPSTGVLPLSVPVRLFVTSPGCSVVPSRASLSFAAVEGGANPPSQTISLTSPQGEVGFLAAGGPPLVSVGPGSGSTPATLVVNVSTAGLAAGTYTSAIGVGCTANGFGGLQPIPVTVTVSAAAGAPVVSPPALTFTGQRGGPNPPSQILAVSSSGAPLGFSLAGTGSFLGLGSSGGTTPANVAVSANLAGLAEGSYDGVITVSVPGAAPMAVPVHLTVTPPGSLLMVSPSALSFTTSQDLDPPLRTLTILSSGAPLAWTATGTASFLSLGSSGGTTPGSTFVEVRVVGLPPGTYAGSVVVSAPGAGTVSVPVSVTVMAFDPGAASP